MIAAGHADAYAQVGKTILSFLYLLVFILFLVKYLTLLYNKHFNMYDYFIGIHCWDMVAGALLVKEAGGTLLDPQSGLDFDYMSRGVLATSSPQLAQQVLDLKLNYSESPRDHADCGGI